VRLRGRIMFAKSELAKWLERGGIA
jgi:hypothetical protein